MRVGALAFQAKKGNFYSELIKRATGSEWSHMFLTLGKFYEREAIFEADRRETVINFIDKYETPEDKIEFYFPRVSQQVINQALFKVLEKYLNVEYGYPQVVGIGAVLALQQIGINIDNPLTAGIVCSELSYYYLEELDLKNDLLKLDKTPNNVSPSDFYKLIKTSSNFEYLGSKSYGSLLYDFK